jgi:hypothetical protein
MRIQTNPSFIISNDFLIPTEVLVNKMDTLDYKINQIRLKSNAGLTDDDFQALLVIHKEWTIKDQEVKW